MKIIFYLILLAACVMALIMAIFFGVPLISTEVAKPLKEGFARFDFVFFASGGIFIFSVLVLFYLTRKLAKQNARILA